MTFRCRPFTLSASFHIRGRLLNASTQAPSPAACSCAITSPQHTQHARDTTRAIHTMQRAANTTRPKQQRECAAARPALAARAHLPRRRLARVARGTGKRGPDLRQQPHLRALFWKPVWDEDRVITVLHHRLLSARRAGGRFSATWRGLAERCSAAAPTNEPAEGYEHCAAY